MLVLLIYGPGRLTPAEAKRLFGAGWGVYLFMWCVTLVGIWLLARVIPPTPDPSVLTAAAAHQDADFLKMLIPANLIDAVGRDYVPAVAVFAIVYGIAIQKIERKSALFEVLQAIQVASVTLADGRKVFAGSSGTPAGQCALCRDSSAITSLCDTPATESTTSQ